MSARARRKNRNRGLKKGHRRESGPTPRHEVRELRDALLPEEPAIGSPVQPGFPSSSAEVPQITTRLRDVGEDLCLVGDAVETEVATRHDQAAAANRTSPTVTAQRRMESGHTGVPAPSTAESRLPRSR